MPRRRKDPDDAPIDGDYTLDQVLNKEKGMTYRWLSDDDIPRFKAMGYVREERSGESARPAFDSGNEGDAGYHVGQLTLFKAPDAVARQWEQRALADAEDRMTTIRRNAKKSGGGFTSQLQR